MLLCVLWLAAQLSSAHLVGPVGVANLSLEEGLVLLLKLPHAAPVAPLRVRIDVHLDHSKLDRTLDVTDIAPRASVENKVNRHFISWRLVAELLADVRLSTVEDI